MKYSGAVAVVEVAGLPTAIACADAMVKAANVTLIGYEITKGGPGMVNVKICGDVGAVQAAVDAGCAVANQITQVMSKVIMPRPHADLEQMLLERNKEAFFSRNFDTEPQLPSKAEQTTGLAEKDASAEKNDAAAEEEPKIKPEIEAEENAAQDKSKIEEQPQAAEEPKKAEQPKAAEETKTKEPLKPKEDAKPNTTSNVHKKNPKDNQGKK